MTFDKVEITQPKPAQKPEASGPYSKLYDFYRNLIERGMAEWPIHSFLPNELDQARAAALYTAGYIRYADGLGWLVYNPEIGTFSNILGKHILCYCLDIMAQKRLDYNGQKSNYKKYAEAACSESGIRHIAKILEYQESIISVAEDYDKDPYLINCRGITVDLRTGEMRPSTPQDLHTKTTVCKPADRIPAPEDYSNFAQFLVEITNGNADIICWLMRFFGYSLSGDTKTAFFANFHGSGRNGKGTLLHTMQYIFADYAAEIPTAIVVDNGKYHNILHSHARLLGIRLGIAADVPAGKMNVESLKTITGNDKINAEFKYKDSFSFKPIVKVVFSSNEQLRITDTGQSIKSRLKYIPFNVSFAGREDTGLEDRIKKEAPEILAALIAEAVEYFKNPGPQNFPHCKEIEQETAEYITSEDIIGQFLDEYTVPVKEACVQAAELYRLYVEWIRGRNEQPISGTKFGRKVIARGLKKNKISGLKYYLDLQIRPERADN